MGDFCIRQGDLLPEIQVTLTDADGVTVDVTDLDVRFHLRPVNSAVVKVDAPMTPVTPSSGIVKYTWADGDTDTAGSYWGECQVTFGDGRTQTFPNPDYLSISVSGELA